MSYAPEILIKVSNDIIMILRCPGSCVGVGFWNLVQWKSNRGDNETGINPFEDAIHAMIHICDSFELMTKVEIQFGVKGDSKIENISIKIIDADGSILLYTFPKQQTKTTDGNSNNSNTNRKRTTLNDNDELNSSSPPPKKRKLADGE